MADFNGEKYMEALEEYVEKKRQENTKYQAFSGNEHFKVNGESRFSVLDVWKFAYCQLPDDVMAEFLVAKHNCVFLHLPTISVNFAQKSKTDGLENLYSK